MADSTTTTLLSIDIDKMFPPPAPIGGETFDKLTAELGPLSRGRCRILIISNRCLDALMAAFDPIGTFYFIAAADDGAGFICLPCECMLASDPHRCPRHGLGQCLPSRTGIASNNPEERRRAFKYIIEHIQNNLGRDINVIFTGPLANNMVILDYVKGLERGSEVAIVDEWEEAEAMEHGYESLVGLELQLDFYECLRGELA